MLEVNIRNLVVGDKEVLSYANFAIKPGEIVAIIGSSGSGKSTLINAICNLNKDYNGLITYNGEDLKLLKNNQMRQLFKDEICLIMQDNGLVLSETVEKNIKYIPNVRKKYNSQDVIGVLTSVGLTSDVLKKKVSNLSGGEQQRVAVAKAIMKKSKLIICDEPTGNLDVANARQIYDLFSEMAKMGIAIVIVTHDMNIFEYADTVYKLSKNQIIRVN